MTWTITITTHPVLSFPHLSTEFPPLTTPSAAPPHPDGRTGSACSAPTRSRRRRLPARPPRPRRRRLPARSPRPLTLRRPRHLPATRPQPPTRLRSPPASFARAAAQVLLAPHPDPARRRVGGRLRPVRRSSAVRRGGAPHGVLAGLGPEHPTSNLAGHRHAGLGLSDFRRATTPASTSSGFKCSKIRVSDYPSGFGYPRDSVLEMDSGPI